MLLQLFFAFIVNADRGAAQHRYAQFLGAGETGEVKFSTSPSMAYKQARQAPLRQFAEIEIPCSSAVLSSDPCCGFQTMVDMSPDACTKVIGIGVIIDGFLLMGSTNDCGE